MLVVNALTGLVGEYARNDNSMAALAANHRLLALDPWSEPTHRRQVLMSAHTGDRAAALVQYETCRRMLADEFGIEPMPETTALDYLRRRRCLLVLDNLESILQGDEHSGHFRPGYETYEQLIRRLAEGEHRSCLLLTSREQPSAMIHLGRRARQSVVWRWPGRPPKPDDNCFRVVDWRPGWEARVSSCSTT